VYVALKTFSKHRNPNRVLFLLAYRKDKNSWEKKVMYVSMEPEELHAAATKP
jgi:hypothetical protein